MITDQDVTKLKKTFLTKEEFKKAAKSFAAKKDLDVQTNRIDALVYEVGDVKVEIAELSDKFDSLKEELTSLLQRFLERIDTIWQEEAAGAVTLARHTRQIKGLATHTKFTLPN